MLKYPHEDKDSFVQSIQYTAGVTNFSEVLIEKDYFCSIVLSEIFSSDSHKLIFKGGTLLNKTHAGFYRLSEDLDFSIDVSPAVRRGERRNLINPVKKEFLRIVKYFSFSFSKNFEGRNKNNQYQGEIEYESFLLDSPGRIKIDVGLRENVLEPKNLQAQTLLRDPFLQEAVIEEFEIKGLSCNEAYAEKIRAALSRQTPAIRDIFDLDYALKNKLFEPQKISKLIKKKFQVQNCTSDVSLKRKKEFLSQIETKLRPVLRKKDFEAFDFEVAWIKVCELKNLLD